MDTIKVLIIDKNVLVRRAITTILQQHKKFRVDWLHDGLNAVEAVIRDKEPDVVLLSIENVEGTGLDILQKIQLSFSNLPIVVVSPLSKEGAKAAITALRLGAIDFITKPDSKNLILFAERHLKKRLEPLITAIYEIRQRKNLDDLMLESLAQPQKSFKEMSAGIKDHQPIEVVAIGGCTGGVQALFSMLSGLPKDLAIPLLVVQHLPRTYTEYLASCLNLFCEIPVIELQDGDKLKAGAVYIAPGGFQCKITQTSTAKVASIYRGPRENNMRPSIDVLFRSVAKLYGNRALGVLLSGCGCDGLRGAEEIKKQVGEIVVQDPRSSIAPDLPLSAISRGLTKKYSTPQDIARQIIRYSSLKESGYYKRQEKDIINTNFLF